MPIKDWSVCESRNKVRMIQHVETIEKGSNVTNRIEKTVYEFCVCDVCLGHVRIKDFGIKYPKNGAIIEFRNERGRKFPIALHNACFKKAIDDLNEYYSKKG